MKKYFVVFLVLLGLSFASSIGFVDTMEVIQGYNKAITAQADLVQKQIDVQSFFSEKQKEYEKLINPNSSEEEILQLKEELEKVLESKRKELMDLNQKLSSGIESDILNATSIIAEELDLEVVVDKKSILVGGKDITIFVLDYLNNHSK